MAVTVKRKILVVEDNPLNRGLLCEILKTEYDVAEAENGREALARLREEDGNFSLILLDIVMPVMDGYEFLSAVKDDPDFSAIPVIVTTQNDAESEEVTALSCGAADFVVKPYKPQIILHRAANIIHLRESAALVNEFRYDRLTGLYSKEFFCQQAGELLHQNPDKEYDIICSDIVNFKLVNDIFGIPAGDRLLRMVAQVHTGLTAGRGICSHFHADQFACIIERNWEYTEKMFQDSCSRINLLSQTQNIVMKWGIYRVEDRNVSVEQMCDRALLAVRSIKERYNKYFAYYDDELRSKLLQEQEIVDSMEAALAQGQFEIYLQPKYRLKDDRMSGAEALIRWNHPEWGLQSPAVFIPLFERNGFITRLDQYVWDKVCAVMQSWKKRGLQQLPVSVNVSRADIYNADLTAVLMGLLQKYSLSPASLHLEITESAYTENPRQIIETVSHLRELGFVVEMDDFGSGYSSLHMLHEMPVDVLKLDMKFIQSEPVTPVNQEIMRFIINLAHLMSLSVVAEGVETGEQLERLREIGCECVQGYYFSKPVQVKEFEMLMEENDAAIKSALDHKGQPFAGEGEKTAGKLLEGFHLLVAEDNALNQEIAATLLRMEGAVVDCVEDGRQALDAFLASRPGEYDAILMDVQMPVMDGHEATRRIRASDHPLARTIPIIVATANAFNDDISAALAAGMNTHVSKPLDITQLCKTLADCIHK